MPRAMSLLAAAALLLLASAAQVPCLPRCTCTVTSYTCANANIPFLPTGLFAERDALTSIFIANSTFSSVPVGVFVDLPNLKTLSLINNHITSFEDGSLPPTLVALYSVLLDGNLLTEVPTFNLPNLTYLALNNNNISVITPASFAGVRATLRGIQLASQLNKNVSVADGAFAGFPGGTYVDLTSNGVPSLDRGAFAGSNFSSLTLTGNKLTTLPPLMGGLSGTLTSLRVEANRLTSDVFSGALASMPILTALYLDSNPLFSLPSGAFSGMPNLRILSVTNAELTSVADTAFSGCSSLRSLYLGQRNNIGSLAVSDLPSLATLSVSNAGLTSLKISGNHSSLTSVDASINSLSAAPDALNASCPNLFTLKLTNNKITALLATAVANLARLSSLDLSLNLIAQVESTAFRGMGNLTSLLLNNNALATLPAGSPFRDSPSLTTLRLNNNVLTSLPSGTFRGIQGSAQTVIYLNSNAMSSYDGQTAESDIVVAIQKELNSLTARVAWAPQAPA